MWRAFHSQPHLFARRSKKAKKAVLDPSPSAISFIIQVLLVLHISHHVLNSRKYLISESSICNDNHGSLIAENPDALRIEWASSLLSSQRMPLNSHLRISTTRLLPRRDLPAKYALFSLLRHSSCLESWFGNNLSRFRQEKTL
jgi:hypothetical protein